METEAKFRLTHPPRVRQQLRRAGWRVTLPRRRECNWILDDARGSLRRRGLVLRMRRSGTEWRFTVKGPGRLQGGIKRRPEHETAVTDGRALAQALALLGYRVTVRYDRFRTKLGRAGAAGHLEWDETPFGVYLELEGPTAWVRRTAGELGLDLKQAESRTYPELYAAAARRKHI